MEVIRIGTLALRLLAFGGFLLSEFLLDFFQFLLHAGLIALSSDPFGGLVGLRLQRVLRLRGKLGRILFGHHFRAVR